MSHFETLTVTTDSRGVARLTLALPDRHNAMSDRTISELTEAARFLAESEVIRAAILTGAGGSFCAAADFGWMQAQFESSREERIAEAVEPARQPAEAPDRAHRRTGI